MLLDAGRGQGLHLSVDAVYRLAYQRLAGGGRRVVAHIPGNVVLTHYGLNILHCDKPVIVFAPTQALRRACITNVCPG